MEWESVRCEKCEKVIEKIQMYCPYCHDILGQISFHIDGCIESENQKDFLAFPIAKNDAKRFANILNTQGYMYYLLLDLAESENLQKDDNLSYNEFLKSIREKMKYDVFSQAKKGVYCFGEIGDCMKIGFLASDDIITVVKAFSEVIKQENFDMQFPTLKGRETTFPRFDGTVGKITIAENNSENMLNLKLNNNELEKTFCLTLNGAIDFNDYELTQLFRYDHEIKTNKEIFKDFVLSLWIQKEILDDLEWDNIQTVTIETKSHNVPKKRVFGLIGFTGMSKESYKKIENPDKFLDNKNLPAFPGS